MYSLKLNEEQLNVVMKALDLYSRLQMGQVEELINPFSSPFSNRFVDRENVEKAVSVLKKEYFPELTRDSYNGIFSDKTPETSKIAYDIIQVVRNRLAYDKNPSGGFTVDFDDPIKSSGQPLPEIKKENK